MRQSLGPIGAVLAAVGLCVACSGGSGPEGAVSMAGTSTPTPAPAPLFAYNTAYGVGEAAVGSSIIEYKLDAATGKLSKSGAVPFKSPNEPINMVLSPDGTMAYVLLENSKQVFAYAITPKTGALKPLPRLTVSTLGSTSALAISPDGRFLYVTNSMFNPHDNIFAYAIDDRTGALTAVKGAPFSADTGPLDFVIAPSKKFAYAVNQGSSDITGYSVDGSSGALTAVPGGAVFAGDTPWEVTIDPTATIAYAIGHSGILRFAIDPATGALKPAAAPLAVSTQPKMIVIAPTGKFAYVTDKYGVTTYSVDGSTGDLTRASSVPTKAGWETRCVTIARGYLYVQRTKTSDVSSSITAYPLDAATGRLKAAAGPPVAAGSGAGCLVVAGGQDT